MMRHHQTTMRGTSLIETVIFMAVFIPLCATLPVLAKIAQVKMVLPQTVRYLGWNEALTQSIHDHSGNTHETIEIQERIFKNSNVQFQDIQPNTGTEHQRSQWAVQQERLLDFSQPSIQITRNTGPNGPDITQTAINLATGFVSEWSHGSFEQHALQISEHRLTLSVNGFQLGHEQSCAHDQSTASNASEHTLICLDLKHAIATGSSLAAQNKQHMIDQVNSLKPFSSLAPITRNIAKLADASWIFDEGKNLEKAPLHVDVEALPQDRLKEASH